LLLIDSAMPLFAPRTMAFNIPQRFFLIERASICIGFNRLRMALPYHFIHAFLAHVLLEYFHSSREYSLTNQARPVFNAIACNNLSSLRWFVDNDAAFLS